MKYRNDLVKKKAKRSRNGIFPQDDFHTDDEWNHAAMSYLKQIKLLSLQFCIGGSPKQGTGLFQGDTVLLLAIVAMTSSASRSSHSQLARDYILRVSQKPLPRPKPSTYLNSRLDSRKQTSQDHDDQQTVSLSLVCSLMILIIGDEAAAPVLSKYRASSWMWEDIIGLRPTNPESPHCRPHLPATIVAPMMDFLSSLFLFGEEKHHRHGNLKIEAVQDEQHAQQGMMLLLDLIVAGDYRFRRDNIWVAHLVHGLYHQGKGKQRDNLWLIEFHYKCLHLAMKQLSGIAQWSPDRDQGTPQDELVMRPFFAGPARRDFDLLLEQHRKHQKKEILSRWRSVQVREYTYNLIADLSEEDTARHTFLLGDKISFELPDLLFACAKVECAKSLVTITLSSVLKVFRKRILEHDSMIQDDDLEALAAPLLRTLANASFSDSPGVRLASAEWVSELLSHMDPMSASTLGRFMIDDPDPTVSEYVARGTWYLADVGLKEKQAKQDPAVELVDLSDDVERSLLEAELESIVQKLANALTIPPDAASLLLHDFHFNVEEVLTSTTSDRRGTFEKIGLLMRCNQNDVVDKMEIDNNPVCGICYEDCTSDDSLVMHSLPCGHAFCLECWKARVKTTLEEKSARLMNLTCPHQNCSERLTKTDLQIIDLDLLPIWQRAFLHSFVERSQNRRRFCTGPDCTMIAVSSLAGHQASLTAGACVKCSKCLTQFCLACGEPPHIPARCEDLAKFNRLPLSSAFYVRKNTKPCPGCNAAVERDGGCNAMHCSQCNTSFCWICLSLVDAHLPHTCNKYEPSSAASDDERGVFYFERFQAHDQGEVYAQTQITNLEQRVSDISRRVWDVLQERDTAALRSGLDTLVRARRFLKYSYVYSFGNLRNDHGVDGRSVFESYQAALEASTESLSHLTELDLNEIYEDRGSQGIHCHVGAVGVFTELVHNSMQRMLALSGCSQSVEDMVRLRM